MAIKRLVNNAGGKPASSLFPLLLLSPALTKRVVKQARLEALCLVYQLALPDQKILRLLFFLTVIMCRVSHLLSLFCLVVLTHLLWGLKAELCFIGRGMEVDKPVSEVFCHTLPWRPCLLQGVSVRLIPLVPPQPSGNVSNVRPPGPAQKRRQRESEGGD